MVGDNDRHLLMQPEVTYCTVCQLPFFKGHVCVNEGGLKEERHLI